MAESSSELTYEELEITPSGKKPVKIGVAKDKAFCFYYEDNFELLTALGGELVFFSPMEDDALPEGICGLVFGGGYPEEHLKRLTANQSMMSSIKEAGRKRDADLCGVRWVHVSGQHHHEGMAKLLRP